LSIGWMEDAETGSEHDLRHEVPGHADSRLDVRPVGIVYAAVIIGGEESPPKDGSRRIGIQIARIGLVVLGFDLFPPGDDGVAVRVLGREIEARVGAIESLDPGYLHVIA